MSFQPGDKTSCRGICQSFGNRFKFPEPSVSFSQSNAQCQLKGTLGEWTDCLLAMLVIWMYTELALVFGMAALPGTHPQWALFHSTPEAVH